MRDCIFINSPQICEKSPSDTLHVVHATHFLLLFYLFPFLLLNSHDFLLLCSEEVFHLLYKLVVNLLEFALSILLKVF